MPRHVNENVSRRRAWLLSAALHVLVLAGIFRISPRSADPSFLGGPLSIRLGGQGATSTPLGTGARALQSPGAARSKEAGAKRQEKPAQETTGQLAAPPAQADAPGKIAAPDVPTEGSGRAGGAGETGEPSPALTGIGDGAGSATLLGAGGELAEAPRPPYPAWARERGIEGRIELEIEVLATGSVGEVRVVSDTTGSPELVRYTVRWVRKALRYEPARIGGRPVTTYDRRAWVYELKG